MVILILINIVIIVYVYLKYYKLPKDMLLTDEKIKDRDSIIIGYINDQDIENNFDLLLSGIIELNIKEYISIEYNEDGINKYNYIIKQKVDMNSEYIDEYELIILSFLFCEKDEITKEELEEKLKNTFNSYNIQYNELKRILNEENIKQGIIDVEKQKDLKNKAKLFRKISIIAPVIILILSMINIINNSILYMILYVLSNIVANIMIYNASIYTLKGKIIKYSIDSYKINIENKEFLENKREMKDILKDKDFANSVALHIDTQAKRIFIDDIVRKKAIKISKQIVTIILISMFLIVLLGTIIFNMIKDIPKEGLFWIFTIFAISAACIVDIAYQLGAKKK